MDQHGGSQSGRETGARRATGDGSGLMAKGPKRFSARGKVEIVLRLLGGEDLELLSRGLSVTAARLSKWRQ